MLRKKADEQGIPLTSSLELTPLCNLNCQICYIRHTPEDAKRKGGILPTGFWFDLIKQMKASGVLFLGLIGGKIFTRPDIREIYNQLIFNGFQINITTNGVVLADSIPDYLIQNKPRFVTVSVYGGSNETYKAVCGCEHGYDRVMRAIDNLVNANIPVKINFCLVPENMQDLDLVAGFAAERGYQFTASAYSFPPARKVENGADTIRRLTPEEATQCELKLKEYRLGEKFPEYLRYLADEEYLAGTSKHSTMFWCRAGISTFWVNWQGKLAACGMIDDLSVDLRKLPFKDGWTQLQKKRLEMKTAPECAVCKRREGCQACPASMYAENGDFDKAPEYLCRMTEEMIRLAKIAVAKMQDRR